MNGTSNGFDGAIILQALLEKASDCIFLKDSSLKYAMASSSMATLFGMDREDIIGKTDDILFGSVAAEQLRQEDLRVLTGETVSSFSKKPAHGTIHSFETIKFPILDASGEVTGVCGIARDITESKGILEDLKSREDLLNRVFDILPVGLWFADENGRLLRGNPAGIRIWGAEPLVGPEEYGVFKAWHYPSGEVIKPEDWALARSVQKGETIINELLEIEGFDGVRKIILNSTAPVLAEDGSVKGAIIVNQDVSKRMLAEEALRASEEKYRIIAENTGDVITMMDMDLKFTFVSPSIFQLRGYTVEEVMEQTVDQVLTPESLKMCREVLAEEIQRKMTPGEPKRSRTLILEEYHKDGRTFFTEDTLSFITDEGGRPVGILSVSRDITDRVRAESERDRLQKQLLHAVKMESIGKLAGGIAHDFNNLLMGIMHNVRLCSDMLGEGHEAGITLSRIEEDAKRSAGLTKQLLAFARREAITPEILNLSRTVEDALRMLKPLIGEDIDLCWNPPEEELSVLMDVSQVDQILSNLVLNSRDAIRDIGTITVSLEALQLEEAFCSVHREAEPGSYALLTVSDTGTGMDSETKKHIFEPFFSTKTEVSGTGLGLSTVYGAVMQNGGFIDVYSEPFCGTVFRVFLPLCYPVESGEAKAEKEWKLVPGSGETVLVVEDEPSVRETVAEFLRRYGYEVIEAAIPEEAFSEVKKHSGRIDLILTDVVMPGMTGRELVERIRTEFPGIRAIYMSGYTEDAIIKRGVLAGDVDFLSKPFSPEDLARKVRAVLDRRDST